jgi:hypothetical protein
MSEIRKGMGDVLGFGLAVLMAVSGELGQIRRSNCRGPAGRTTRSRVLRNQLVDRMVVFSSEGRKVRWNVFTFPPPWKILRNTVMP